MLNSYLHLAMRFLCYTIIFFAFCWISPSYAQTNFVVYGKMKIEKGSLDGSIEVLKNGSRDRIKAISGSGKFEFKFELNKSYEIIFSQAGYVTKKISFDTKVPNDRAQEEFIAFQFQVTLFKQYEGINFVVFNQPVGRIHYSEEIGDFDYDTDYTKSIQQQLAAVQKEVAKKRKEEEKEEKKKKEKPTSPPPAPVVTAETSITKEAPSTTPKKRTPKPPPPPRPRGDNLVVLHSYTVGEMGFPNLNAYGFINFGDGTGRREITKEQFDEYAKKYH